MLFHKVNMDGGQQISLQPPTQKKIITRFESNSEKNHNKILKDSYIGPTYLVHQLLSNDIFSPSPKATNPRKIHQEWTTSSMTWLYPSSYNATSLACSAATGGGSYAAIYIPVKLAETSTSTTWTETRTYQTTATTLPVFVPTPTDGGMVLGVSLASIALIVVVGAISWQCYLGNVKVRTREVQKR